jgi:predicted Zn-dependent protease with MMP-like domain
MATRKTDASNDDETTKEIVTQVPKYGDDELLGVQSFEDAYALAVQYYGQENLVRADETIGNGFRLLANKDTLIDQKFIALAWRFNPGDFGEFVTMMVVTEDGRKFIVNDGGSGICQQLALFTNATGRHGGMLDENGLTRSDYEYEDHSVLDSEGNPTKRPASTYYINTSA